MVSVVVPAYNAAKRIECSLRSIAAQDYDPIEIVLADDASSDGTSDIALDILERSGRRFRIEKHGENMGVAAARNTGMASASGDYVIFFDADDEADPDFVSALHGAITKVDCDVAFCSYRYRFEETGKEKEMPAWFDASREYTAEELTVMYIFKQIRPAIVTVIFKKSFLGATGIKFTAGCGYGEDVEFVTKIFSRCGKIGFSKKCPYIYVHHDGMTSATSAANEEKSARRYADNADAICRTARNLSEHATSPKVRDIAQNLLSPEGLIKMLNIAAKQNDAAAFYQTLYDPETKRALLASRKYFLQKPEVFLKAAALLIAPRAYFKRRSKP